MKTLKQLQPKLLTSAVFIGLCTQSAGAFSAPVSLLTATDSSKLSASLLAAQPGGQGGQGGQGGGGQGEDFGDLVVLLRGEDGVPTLTPENCQQPLAAPGVSLPASDVGPIDACIPASPTESCLIPIDPATCGVIPGYEEFLQSVDFGRLSVARSQTTVMDKQFADVLVSLSTAQCITQDPSGRLLFTAPDSLDGDKDGDFTELVSRAVDSPLQNLAIYREIMTKGVLGNPAIVLPVPFAGYGKLDTAAKSLGAAADKEGKIDVDLVVYMNQIMGLDDPAVTTLLPKKCITIKQEVQGVVQDVAKCFLDYSAYAYQRLTTYANLPFPANIPATNPIPGYFDYLTLYPGQLTPDGKPLFQILSASIAPTVFPSAAGGSLPGFINGNIGGFAQGSDDARAVINFMHSHPVLKGYDAPVKCDNPYIPVVDVATKLQMPIKMVGGTGREGTLTVSNLKGAPATGTVKLIGKDSNNKTLYNYKYSFTNLAAGKSQAWTVIFKGPSYATTITWTGNASVTLDKNLTNNLATFTTEVTAPNGNGGGGEE